MPRLSTPTQIDDQDKLSRANVAVLHLVKLLALEAVGNAGRGLTEREEAKDHEVDQDEEDRL